MALKLIRYSAWAAVFLIAVSVGVSSVLWYQQSDPATAAVKVGGDFSLVDTNGTRVTEADFLGKPRAMFFGFTHCPDVCPTTLYEASGWLQALGPDADKLSVMFISVDPERDTPEVLGDYISAFENGIVGLTGSTADVDAVVKAYRVYARKVETDDGDYTVDHTASVYLMDENGKFSGSIRYQEDHDVAVEKLRNLIARAETAPSS